MPAPSFQSTAHRQLNPRARGWLRFLWRKATTADDWSEDGEPHPWWDRYSSAPMTNFPRFDLSESSYALGIMADMTPAWREVYAQVLEQLAERHLTYWAAVDWLTQFGPDPDRANYPDAWKGTLVPEKLWGNYDTPGWTANGVKPWGVQADPVGADGNLFFKGWLSLVMALHAYVSGERKWHEPFEVAGVERTRFEWTQPRIADHLAAQWNSHPEGPHCENTKVWPFCLSAAGLGLQMYDAVNGRTTHHVYERWLDYAKCNYFGIDKHGELQWTTFYYDPLLCEHMRHGPSDGLPVSFYMLPQDPEFAEFLYHAAVAKMGWKDASKPLRAPADPRFIALGLALAHEWGDDVTEARLRIHAEEHFEPRSFGDTGDEFGWWFNFGEDWPRGQISALLIMSEVGTPGAWSRLFREPDLTKFEAPTVEGADFPALGIAQAWNDPEHAVLRLETYAADSARKGSETRFSVTNLPDAERIEIRCAGQPYERWRVTGAGTIEIASEIDDRLFEIVTGYRPGQSPNEDAGGTKAKPSNGAQAARAAPASALDLPVPLARPVTCPCCVTAAPA